MGTRYLEHFAYLYLYLNALLFVFQVLFFHAVLLSCSQAPNVQYQADALLSVSFPKKASNAFSFS